MSTMTRHSIRRGVAALGMLSILLSAEGRAGGIQMSAERPEAPFTRDAKTPALFVNTFECGRAHDFKLQATAEGLVAGKRSTIPLVVEKAGREGRFAITRQWPLDGQWVVIVTTQAWDHTANLVVHLAKDGGFVPKSGARDGAGFIEMTGSEVVHRKLTTGDIDGLVAGRPVEEKAEVRKVAFADWLAQALGF